MIDRAEEHLGAERAARYLRKFYPWYLERLEAPTRLAPPRCSAARPRRAPASSSSELGEPAAAGLSRWADAPRRRLARARQRRGVPRPPDPRLGRGGRRAAPALPARLPVELLRLAPRCSSCETEHAVLAFDFLGFGLSEKPRDHDYTLLWQADLAEELVRRHGDRPPVFICRPRHGHLGRQRADGARPRRRARDSSSPACCCFNGSMVQEAASPTLGQRLLRSRLGPLAARLSSERFFRQQFGSIFSPGHPLTDEEAADQWSLISRTTAASALGHQTIRYMDERVSYAERWHGAIRDWPEPLSLAWGMLDPVATPTVLDAVRELRPAAPVTELRDLGHYPQIEDPDRVAAALTGRSGAPDTRLLDHRSATALYCARSARTGRDLDRVGAGSFFAVRAGVFVGDRNRDSEGMRRVGTRVPDHPRGSREAQGGDRAPVDRQAARGRRADQGSARVRRHRRELRVRRRQERAGDARAADRLAPGAAPPRRR